MALKAVYLDVNEDAVYPWLKDHNYGEDVSVQVKNLTADAGLLLDDGKVLVERKTWNDLIASCTNGHLLSQAHAMTAEIFSDYAKYLVILGGPDLFVDAYEITYVIIDERTTKTPWNFVQSVLADVQRLGIVVVWRTYATEYPNALKWIAKSEEREIIVNPVSVKFKRSVMQSPAEYILSAFDGIGPELAKRLIEKCSTLAWALEWLTDEHSDLKVEGIGAKKRRAIKAILGLKENEKLAVVCFDNE